MESINIVLSVEIILKTDATTVLTICFRDKQRLLGEKRRNKKSVTKKCKRLPFLLIMHAKLYAFDKKFLVLYICNRNYLNMMTILKWVSWLFIRLTPVISVTEVGQMWFQTKEDRKFRAI